MQSCEFIIIASLLAACSTSHTAQQGADADTTLPGDGGDLAPDASEDTRDKKVLLIFIDGFLPDAIDTSSTPAIDDLLVGSAWSRTTRAESTTISGSGWSSFLTGTHFDKHNVVDNEFANPNYTDYQHIFARLQQARPDAVVGGCQSWAPIETGLVLPSTPDLHSYHDYYDAQYDEYDCASNDFFSLKSADADCATDMLGFAADPNVELLVVMFDALDGVAHKCGYGAEYVPYQKMLTATDRQIGDIVSVIKARPNYDDEDWLIILGTDHAGNPANHHGLNIPAHRLTPLIVSGPSVASGEIWPAPQTIDIFPTAMKHLGVAIDPAWGIDGVAVGLTPTTLPTATMDANLIFNGDAEYERGYHGYTYDDVHALDAWLPGWYDPGNLTVVRYDTGGGYPGPGDPGPADRGSNYFAGGGVEADTAASLWIDVSALATDVDTGTVTATLSGWLGGFAGQGDAVALTASYQDAAGTVLGSSVIGPVSAADRGNLTGMLLRSTTAAVPTGTRRAVVTLSTNVVYGFNDGYADNLSLVFSKD